MKNKVTYADEAKTNVYMQAADVRFKLHEMFQENKYDFQWNLYNAIERNTKYAPAIISIDTLADAIACYFNADDKMFMQRTSEGMGMRNVDTVIYVDVLRTMSDVIHQTIYELKEENPGEQDLIDIYAFFTNNLALGYGKSAIAMLMDITIYADHFNLRI